MHAHQRPKLETYGDDGLFVVLKTVRYVDHEEVIETGELMVFIGPDFVVTVRHGEAADLAGVRGDLEARPELLAIGPGAVLYAVRRPGRRRLPPAAGAVEEDVDEIEDQVFPLAAQPTERIYKLKREVMDFRRAVEPLAAGDRRAGRRHGPLPGPAHRRRTSGTCTTTSCGPPSRSRRWTSCSTASCRPTWRRCRCARTRTCARSAPGSRSPAVEHAHRRHLRHELRRTCRSSPGRTATRTRSA